MVATSSDSIVSSTIASCRHGTTLCDSDKSCWSGSGNSTVPSNCKCCRGWPFFRGGECLRWAPNYYSKKLFSKKKWKRFLPFSETATETPNFIWSSCRVVSQTPKTMETRTARPQEMEESTVTSKMDTKLRLEDRYLLCIKDYIKGFDTVIITIILYIYIYWKSNITLLNEKKLTLLF